MKALYNSTPKFFFTSQELQSFSELVQRSAGYDSCLTGKKHRQRSLEFLMLVHHFRFGFFVLFCYFLNQGSLKQNI